MLVDIISNAEGYHEYCARYHYYSLFRVLNTAGDTISSVMDTISTVDGVEYCGGITSVLRRMFSVMEGYH